LKQRWTIWSRVDTGAPGQQICQNVLVESVQHGVRKCGIVRLSRPDPFGPSRRKS
jgi:hypothetical protein